jgi:hypothetical protein
VSLKIHVRIKQDALEATVDDDIIEKWMKGRLTQALRLFRRQLNRGGGVSAPGDYPIKKSGLLGRNTSTTIINPRRGVIESDTEYAGYLAGGTSKMKPRKMAGNALKEVLQRQPMRQELASAARWVTRGTGGRSSLATGGRKGV